MKYHYFLPYYSIFSYIPLTKVDPNFDITFFLTLTKFLSFTGLIDSSYVDRNNHLLNVTFAVLVYSGFRALPPLASSQHPLFLVKIIHSWPKLAPGLNTFAGSVFFINDIWLNSASTYCGRSVIKAKSKSCRIIQKNHFCIHVSNSSRCFWGW